MIHFAYKHYCAQATLHMTLLPTNQLPTSSIAHKLHCTHDIIKVLTTAFHITRDYCWCIL